MTAAQLVVRLKEALAAYWRQRAALRIYSAYADHPDLRLERLDYKGVPEFGIASGFLQSEALPEALAALEDYFASRLAPDTFLALLANFETFFVHQIQARGGGGTGTLGALQHALQLLYHIPSNRVEDLDEIRERRNAVIHHGGRITPKYRAAAAKVWIRSAGNIADPHLVAVLSITPEYLSYVVDALCKYAAEVK
jgi:hypothetical protein